ncbi:MAG: NAD(P)-binding domain-containing protein, partial [Thermoanaerobaculia bacterium]|nr:NAD(P)-binding domain-containing protein [Thermoanaerobaculia bacterium]
MMPIGVLGAGSWGTALAVHYAAQGQEVRLWARRREAAEALAAARTNEAYLPGVHLPESLRVTADLGAVVACDPILVVVPSHGYREVLREVLRRLDPARPHALVSATKGIEL